MNEPLSHTNPRIKSAAQLKRAKKRRAAGRFFLEGPKIIAIALECGIRIRELFVLDDPDEAIIQQVTASGGEVLKTTERGFLRLRDVVTPQGMIGVADVPEYDPVTLASGSVVVLAGVQDPGNVGAVLRTAAYFGFDGALLVGDCADLLNAKTLRASAGASLFFPARTMLLDAFIDEARACNVRLFATSPHEGVLVDEINNNTPFALLIGAEGGGLPPELTKLADTILRIPRPGRGESLNAATAAGILMYALRPHHPMKDH